MSVYFIRAGAEGPIKIGTATDVHRRVTVMQTNHHERLYLLAVIDGDVLIERSLQKRFAKHRLSGEWFSPATEILDFIGSLPSVEKPKPDLTETEVMLASLGGSSFIARIIGIPVNVVSNWKRRGVPWHWRPKLADMARKHEVALPRGFLTPEVAAQ